MGESALLQFGFDDAAVRNGCQELAARMLATKAKVEPSLTYTPHVDLTEMQAGLQRIRSEWASFTTATSGPGGMGGKGKMNMGLIGAQVQDIAVQLQNGTSAATVFAQQGSQLASIFGPTGMVIGAAAAGVGLLATTAINSKNRFDELITSTREMVKDLGLLNRVGSLSELSAGVGKAKEKLEEVAKEMKGLSSASSMLGPLAYWNNPRNTELGVEQAKLTNEIEASERRSLEISEGNLRITTLRNQGRTQEADALERQVALQAKLAGIEGMNFAPNRKAILADNAKEEARQIEIAIERAAALAKQKARETALAGLETLRQSVQSAEFSALPDDDKLKAFADKIKKIYADNAAVDGRGRRFEQTPEALGRAADQSQAAGDFQQAEKFRKAQLEILNLEAQRSQLETRIGEQIANQAAAKQREADEATKQQQKLNFTKEEFNLEQQLLQAKAAAAGKSSDEVDRLDRQLRIMRLQQTLMTSHNTDAQTALGLATQRVNAEDAITKAVKQRQQAEAQQNIQDQIKIAQLQAAGRNGAAQKLQAQINLKAKAKEIEDATGVSPQEAEKQARTLINAQEKAARREARRNGDPVRAPTHGFSHGGKDSFGQSLSDPFRGLNALAAMNGRPPVNGNQVIPLNANPNAINKAAQQLAARNAANAKAQNKAESTVTLTEGPQILALLGSIDRKIVFGN